jgi:hypothetical protein
VPRLAAPASKPPPLSGDPAPASNDPVPASGSEASDVPIVEASCVPLLPSSIDASVEDEALSLLLHPVRTSAIGTIIERVSFRIKDST